MNDGPARVLEGLRSTRGGPCSGESLSRDLGVTRAQIWKHVETLRTRGYDISGEPGGGYRLLATPDRLYPEEVAAGLDTRWLGQRIEYLDVVDSTNRIAFELGRDGAPAGTAVIAEQQTAGRGRLGRAFFSPPHLNLYTSLLLRPEISTADAPTLIHAAAIACADAIAQELDDPDAVEIKWPNDVLLDGRKTSGILMELNAEATRVEFAVLGIGVNLNVAQEDLPDEFRHRATSLRSHSGRRLDRVAFTQRLYGILEGVLEAHDKGGFAAIRERYEARFRMSGRRVRVIGLRGEEMTGRATGIASDGALLIEGDGGERKRVIAGDVTLAKEQE
jgi:BirA family biotin operon repressor/biotin-[acetyl-CoA-carboxylase] ligase